MKSRHYLLLVCVGQIVFASSAYSKAWWIFDQEDENSDVYEGASNTFQISDTEKKCRERGFSVKISDCTAQNKNSGLLCPLNADMTDECCDKEYSYILTSSCSNNTTPSPETCGGRYKCICDPIKYPAGWGRESCSGKFAYNEVNYCIETHVNSNGSTSRYYFYTGCTCAGNYARCNPAYHLHGVGEGCRDGDHIYYARCACDSGYNKRCLGSGAKNPNDYCLFNTKRYYKECNEKEADDKTDDSSMASTEQ